MFDLDDIRIAPKSTAEDEWFSDNEISDDAFDDEYDSVPSRSKKALRSSRKRTAGTSLLAVAGGLLIILIAVAAFWLHANFIFANGLYPRDARALDLREKKISVKHYEKLAQELPDCDIHWNVPIAGVRFDCRSESLTLSEFRSEELPLFTYFTQLKTLDLTAAEIGIDQYEAIAAALPECYIRWSIPIGGSRYDSAAAEITVSEFTETEVEYFALFDTLTTVDATACRNYDALLALKALLPETEVLWTVELNDLLLDQNTTAITVDKDIDRLPELLEYLPLLEWVTVNNAVDQEVQLALVQAHPDVIFDWDVILCGKTFRSTATELSFAGEPLTPSHLTELTELLTLFPFLETLDLRDCGFNSEDLLSLRETSGVNIEWTFDMFGVSVSSTATEIDLSGREISDVSLVENMLPYFSRLEKVIMSHCGISDEEMDALDKRHETIRFVWTVQFGSYELRTDATNFIVTKDPKGRLHDHHMESLKYCTDLVGLDLGHNFITDISFVRHMPKLQYLIMAENPVADLSPLEELHDLIYLEIFLSNIKDLTPLLSLTKLEDLNICHIPADGENAYSVLSQMTWLKRLWYSGHRMSKKQVESLESLLPDCEMMMQPGVESVHGNWHYGENYYNMRDLFGMYYMDENGNRIEPDDSIA